MRTTRLGPEVLTAASDNDPTNVGTAVLVGAQTGYQLSWVALLVARLLAVVLTVAAHVGIVARDDLQSLVRRHYGRGAARLLLTSAVVVNLVTTAADLQAGASGLGILAGLSPGWFVPPLGLGLVVLLTAGRYGEVVRVMRYVLVGFLAFGAAAVFARPDWTQVLRSSVVPALSLRPEYLSGALALVGTTITPYVYLWETIAVGVETPPRAGRAAAGLRASRAGAAIGAVATVLILWSILVMSAATLGARHETVTSVQAAAQSLRPAGRVGGSRSVRRRPARVGRGRAAGSDGDDGPRHRDRVLLAPQSVRDVRDASGFYSLLGASIVLAAAVDLAGVPLLDTLAAASVIGGLGTPIGLALLIGLACSPAVMGTRRISARLAAVGGAVTGLVGMLGAVYLLAGLRSVI
jgi:Mn2+/Fe2+ NRAMP family transporter